jgi:multiple sugar transport system permease protein
LCVKKGTGLSNLKKNPGKNVFILCGLLPLILWMFLFVVYPFVISVSRSFTNWSLSSGTVDFTGLQNYAKFFSDRIFSIAVKNTVISVFGIVPFTIIFALLLALAFNSVDDISRKIFMPVYFLPSVVSVVAIASVWRWLYHPSYGLVNYFLSFFHIPSQAFLQSPKQALPSIIVMIIWQEMGYYAVILLAALKNLPKVYYEAATIDGAGKFRKFRTITIPLLTPTILFTSIMSIINAFQIFTPIHIMTRGGPGDSSMVFALHIYRTGIGRLDMGYASALAMVLFIIIMAITILQWKLVKSDWEF